MKKIFTLIILLSLVMLSTPAFAGTHGTNGKVTAKSIGAGALSLLIWPGIGQAVNDQSYEKNLTHALLGLTGIFRIWSCYDAVVDRQGGVWKNRI
jgi:TM2 domain-containing membrane protein YozV